MILQKSRIYESRILETNSNSFSKIYKLKKSSIRFIFKKMHDCCSKNFLLFLFMKAKEPTKSMIAGIIGDETLIDENTCNKSDIAYYAYVHGNMKIFEKYKNEISLLDFSNLAEKIIERGDYNLLYKDFSKFFHEKSMEFCCKYLRYNLLQYFLVYTCLYLRTDFVYNSRNFELIKYYKKSPMSHHLSVLNCIKNVDDLRTLIKQGYDYNTHIILSNNRGNVEMFRYFVEEKNENINLNQLLPGFLSMSVLKFLKKKNRLPEYVDDYDLENTRDLGYHGTANFLQKHVYVRDRYDREDEELDSFKEHYRGCL